MVVRKAHVCLLVVMVSLPDADLGPPTLASTITPLSSPGLGSPSPFTQLDELGHDNEMDPGECLNFDTFLWLK